MIFQIDYQPFKAPVPGRVVEGLSYLIQIGIEGQEEKLALAKPFVPDAEEFRARLDRLKALLKQDESIHLVHVELDGGRGYLRVETKEEEDGKQEEAG